MTYANITDVALGDLIDETTFNQILANLRALYAPASVHVEINNGSDYTTTGTSFADVDSANLKITLTLDAASDVLVSFHGLVTLSASLQSVLFDVTDNGVRVSTDDGITGLRSGSNGPNATGVQGVSFVRLLPGLAAGSHEFRLQWRVSTGTGTLYAGAGTSGVDVHPQFWAAKL